MPKIHPTALVSPGAELADDVEIAAYAIIGGNVKVNSGTTIGAYTCIAGQTTIGQNNKISPYVSIGQPPQDITYKGEPTKVIIGDNNTLREFVTINLGTVKGENQTLIGNNNFIMAYCHIAHDCILEDNIIMANAVQLGGHVKVERYASFGGLAGAHHFVTIGQHSFVGGLRKITQDVPPFMIVDGQPARVRGVNVVGLERRGFTDEAIRALKSAYKLLWQSENTPIQAIKIMEKHKKITPEVAVLIQFLKDVRQGKQGRYREAIRKPGF